MSTPKDSQGPVWEIFIQKKPGQPFVHQGSLHAFDKEMAIQNARDLYGRRGEGTSIWAVPSNAIVASSPEDIGPFFDPQNDKVYRHPTFYSVPEGIKHM